MTSTQELANCIYLVSKVILLLLGNFHLFLLKSVFVSVYVWLCRRVRVTIVQVRAPMRNLEQAITRKWKKRTTMGMSGTFYNESHEAALDSLQTAGPYADKLIAGELWMQEYNVHRQEAEEEENELLERK